MRINFLIFILFNSVLSFGQIDSKLIEFDHTTWDFGEVDEAKGSLEHLFTFTNKSDQDFIIRDVQASCGCTTPEWSNKPIKPGGKGYVKAIFNPTGMRGEAFKSVMVYGNFKDDVARILEIKGKIFSYRFGEQMYIAGQKGYLRMLNDKLDFGNVLKGSTYSKSLFMVNDGADSFHLTGYKDASPWLKLWPESGVIAPGDTLVIHAELDASKINDWGDVSSSLYIKTDDKFYFYKEIFVIVNAMDDFSKLSKSQKKKAAVIHFDKTSVDFGNIKSGAKKTGSFTLTNKGKTTLVIHKTYAVCSCTVLGNLKKELAPGESIEVQVEFDSVFKSGKQTKAITFYTNDPVNPVTQIVVTAVVSDHH